MNLGNDECVIELCTETIQKIFKSRGRDIGHITLISRLVWKNLVFKVVLKNKTTYSVKLILNVCEPERRFCAEKSCNKLLFNEKKSFNIIASEETFILNEEKIFAILVRDWLYGISYMELMKNDFKTFEAECLPSIVLVCNELWASKSFLQFDSILSNISRFGLSPDEVFSIYKEQSQLMETVVGLYNRHQPKNKDKRIINSDFSLHEFIVGADQHLNIIDWEELSIGNTIIDVAGVFYSIYQHIAGYFDYANLFNFLKKYLSMFHLNYIDDFIYFFIERIVMADYLTNSNDYKLIELAVNLINDLEDLYG